MPVIIKFIVMRFNSILFELYLYFIGKYNINNLKYFRKYFD